MKSMPDLQSYFEVQFPITTEAGIQPIVDTLRQRKIPVAAHCGGHADMPRFVDFLIKNNDGFAWFEMIERLNATNDNAFYMVISDQRKTAYHILQQINVSSNISTIVRIVFNTSPDHAEKLAKETQILAQAIRKGEYVVDIGPSNNKYDIKLGYSCNNNCKHCVIKPDLWKLEEESPGSVATVSEGMDCYRDRSFEDIIDIFRSKDFQSVDNVVITGGEPTRRSDIVPILRWLYYRRPDIKIVIQTNGRNLKDKELVKKIRRYTKRIVFVIAIHGPEEIHNMVVDNRKEEGNPYRETIQGIKNLQELFGTDLEMRSEMVLSNYNYSYVFESIIEQHEQFKINSIGISYPHLEGFSKEKVDELCPAMVDLMPMLNQINNYLHKHSDLIVETEEIPKCVYNQALDKPLRIGGMAPAKDKNIIVAYPERFQSDFISAWVASHEKLESCCECMFDNECPGVWWENLRFNEGMLLPVKNSEEVNFGAQC